MGTLYSVYPMKSIKNNAPLFDPILDIIFGLHAEQYQAGPTS